MSDFDDAIDDMTVDLLLAAGGEFVYRRGAESTTVTLRRSNLPPVQMESGGVIVEVSPVDFIALTVALPYAVPLAGDKIIGGAEQFEVMPTTSNKCYRQISPPMIRIHTNKVR